MMHCEVDESATFEFWGVGYRRPGDAPAGLPEFAESMQAKLVDPTPVAARTNREGSTVRSVLFSAVS